MEIRKPSSDEEIEGLDRLLWDVLWRPLGMPRDIRESFSLDLFTIELVAIDNDEVIGGLVANRISASEMEIRHIAVRPDRQGSAVGRKLVNALVDSIRSKAPLQIRTFARSTSFGFFRKLGFKTTGEILEHPDFARHGISIRQMSLKVSR